MIGRAVSHYRILSRVGAGGMGVVYLAEDTLLARKVALKFLSPNIAEDPHSRARFMREAQAESSLDHPNIATIYEIGDWEEQLFIAMAYYEGETLKDRLARAPMSVEEATSGTEATRHGARGRAPFGDRPPRPEARKCDADTRRSGEDSRLRAGEDPGRRRGNRHPDDRRRPRGGDHCLHGAGAGPGRGGRRARRHLGVRCHSL